MPVRATERFGESRFMRLVMARERLFAAVAAALVVYWLQPSDWRDTTRFLVAWNLAATLYITSTLRGMMGATADEIRRIAALTDESRFIVLTLCLLAAAASLAAIVAELGVVKDVAGLAKAGHLALTFLTILSAWFFIHLLFAQHYAHEYFVERTSEIELSAEFRSGLVFPGGQTVVFSDFLYFAFVIGVACQTADVSISSRPMRRLALIHCIAAFFFNTMILALTINMAAGLI